ncbi:MAG: HEAT repeat domain-containing protein [Thermoanaerobaculales bacterium]|nr:HEAT repeat domain-containing protein [Thermoanaerobaculales bacterium]
MIRRTSGLTLMLLLAAAFPSANSFFIDYDETRIDRSPDVAIDGAGNAVVVWSSQIPRGAQQLNGIRLRRIDRNGTALGNEYRIDRLPGFLARSPAVDLTPDEKTFVVVWEGGSEGERSRRRIWARIFGADGQPVGPEIRIDQQPLTHELFGLPPEFYGGPRVSMASSGEFVVVWRSEGQKSCDRFNISARRFSADGKALCDEFLVNEDASWSQLNPDVDHDSTGRFVVVWQDGRWIGTTEERSRIRGRIFNRAGEAFGPEFVLSRDARGAAAVPALAVAADGTFVCVWKARAGIDPGVRLQARSFDSDGGPLGTRVEIEPTSTGIDHPGIVLVDDRDFMIFWTDQDFDKPGGTHIRAQTFTKTGQIKSDSFFLSPQTCDDRSRPALAVAANGVTIAVWQISRSDGIEGRRFVAGLPLTPLPSSGMDPKLSDLVSDLRQKLLNHRNDDQTRRKVAIDLACMQRDASSVFEDLARCLEHDQAPQVRAACAAALAAAADPPAKAIPHLRKSLVNDAEALVRSAAASAIGDLREDAIVIAPVLMAALDDESSGVVSSSGLALGKIGANSAIETMVKKLEGDSKGIVDSGLVLGLGELADHKEAFLGLESFSRRCIGKASRLNRESRKHDSIGEYFWRYLGKTNSGDPSRVNQAVKIAKERLEGGRIGVITDQEEQYREYYEWIDRMLVRYQEYLEEKSKPLACECLLTSARAISRVDPLTPEAVSLFSALLSSAGPPSLRKQLLRIVTKMGARAEGLSSSVLRFVENPSEVRPEAICTIGAIDPGSDTAIGVLGRVIDDEDPVVRVAVIQTLISMSAKAIWTEKEALVVRLNDDEAEVRELAERALDLIEIEADSCDQKSRATPEPESVTDEHAPSPTTNPGAVRLGCRGRS